MPKVQNGEEILPKVLTPSVRRTNVTDDRRICDSKDPNIKTNSSVYRLPRTCIGLCSNRAYCNFLYQFLEYDFWLHFAKFLVHYRYETMSVLFVLKVKLLS